MPGIRRCFDRLAHLVRALFATSRSRRQGSLHVVRPALVTPLMFPEGRIVHGGQPPYPRPMRRREAIIPISQRQSSQAARARKHLAHEQDCANQIRRQNKEDDRRRDERHRQEQEEQLIRARQMESLTSEFIDPDCWWLRR